MTLILCCAVAQSAYASDRGDEFFDPQIIAPDGKNAASILAPDEDNVPPLVLWPYGNNVTTGCKSIRNTSDTTYFVPYNSEDEWNAFLEFLDSGDHDLSLSSNGCCAPQQVTHCGQTFHLGTRSAVRHEEDNKSNYGAQGDVYGPYTPAGNYSVTYVCNNRAWVKAEESGNCDGTPVCGTNNGGTFGSLSTSGTRSCRNGTAVNYKSNGGAYSAYLGPWTWQCSLTVNNVTNTANCSANYQQVPIAGRCAYPNGAYLAGKPGAGGCNPGTASPVTTTSGGPPYKWTCTGLYGGSTVNCQTLATAPTSNGAPVNGSCGTANTTYIPVKPTTNLCASGTATAVSGSGPWTWRCNGSNGGSNSPLCTANKCLACAGTINYSLSSPVTQVTAGSCTMDVKYTWDELTMREIANGTIDLELTSSTGHTFSKSYGTFTAEEQYCSPCNIRLQSVSNALFHYKANSGQCGSMSNSLFTTEPVVGTTITPR